MINIVFDLFVHTPDQKHGARFWKLIPMPPIPPVGMVVFITDGRGEWTLDEAHVEDVTWFENVPDRYYVTLSYMAICLAGDETWSMVEDFFAANGWRNDMQSNEYDLDIENMRPSYGPKRSSTS